MSFDEIIGHEGPIGLLRSALTRGRLAHAYLFYGEEGIGKRLTAQALARATNCETMADDACGACASCRWAAAATHPDIRELRAAGKGRVIRIESVRELANALALTPAVGRLKVAIIDNAERLNLEASNALLKTLEEPPDHSLILLVSSRPGHLLPTLLSRCIRIRFAPLAPESVCRIVMRERKITPSEAERITALAMGRLPDALQEDPEAMAERTAAWINDLGAESISDPMRLLSAAERNGSDAATAESFLLRLTSWLRDAVVVAQDAALRLDHASSRKELIAWAAAYKPAGLLELYRRASRALTLLERNVNPRLLVEDLFFRLRDLRIPPPPSRGET